VLVHGNPTWGFLYRNFIGPLTEAGHRAIVPSATGPVGELLTRPQRGIEQHFRSKPARIMWPMRDPGFTPAVLEQWRKTLPDAPVTQLDDASHYVQEDAYERIVPELVSFLTGTSA
jgi:hypothetical protein